MKVIIGNNIYDTEKWPVVFAFENDEERKHVAGHLLNMEPKEGVRLYASYPDDLDGHKIIENALTLLDESRR